MHVKRFIVWFSLFLGGILQGYAQYQYPPQLIQAHADIFSLKEDSLLQTLSLFQRQPAYKGTVIWLQQTFDFVKVVISEDAALLKNYKRKEQERINQLKRLPKTSPWYLFILAEMKIQGGYVRFLMGKEREAVISWYSAYQSLKLNAQKFPQFAPTCKSLGVMHVIFGAIPTKYQWITKLFGFHGTIAMGFSEIQLAANKSPGYIADEAELYQILVPLFLSQDKGQSLQQFQKFNQEHPRQVLIQYLYAMILIKNAKALQAKEILLSQLKPAYIQNFPFYYYQLGNAYFYQGAFAKAIEYYQYFLQNFKGLNYIKDARYKMALAYRLLGQSDKAIDAKGKCLSEGNAFLHIDQTAEEQVAQVLTQDIQLLRVRILIDGGASELVEEMIAQESTFGFTLLKDKTEWMYRKARFYDLQGKTLTAISLYQETIKLQEKASWYFAPNSCLHLAYLFRKTNPKLSQFYLKSIFNFDNYPYQSSIEQKAKVAQEVCL